MPEGQLPRGWIAFFASVLFFWFLNVVRDSVEAERADDQREEVEKLLLAVRDRQRGVGKEFTPWKDQQKLLAAPESEKFCGVLEAGSYAYYRIEAPGPYLLSLWNVTGDPDIYVSEKVARPTFDLENHCASAAEPGADSLVVPRWFARPVAVAVYGHPRHDQSVYCIQATFAADSFPSGLEENGTESLEEISRIRKSSVLYPVDGVASVLTLRDYDPPSFGIGMMRIVLEELADVLFL